jgi:hypothetical protein
MTKRTRRKHSGVLKAEVAMAGFKGDQTLSELAKHSTSIRSRPYLRAYASVAEARDNLAWYFNFYNTRKPHQALDGMTRIRLASTSASWQLPHSPTWGLHLRNRENCSDQRNQLSVSTCLVLARNYYL